MSGVLNPLLAFLAGALTILSPCVLPLVPIVLGSAAQRSRGGPLALAAGLVVSFTAVGFLVATLGSETGLDSEQLRWFGAILLLLAGLVLLSQRLQDFLAQAAAPLANWASRRQQHVDGSGLLGQALIGVLLGLVWSPCVGPTLGAATVLAAQGTNLGQVAFTMAAFALGIAASLLVLAFAARGLAQRWRRRLLSGGKRGKQSLGLLLVLVAALILTGMDHLLEGWLVEVSPAWLTDLTTRF